MGSSASTQLDNYTEEEKKKILRFSASLEGYGEEEKLRLMQLCESVTSSPEPEVVKRKIKEDVMTTTEISPEPEAVKRKIKEDVTTTETTGTDTSIEIDRSFKKPIEGGVILKQLLQTATTDTSAEQTPIRTPGEYTDSFRRLPSNKIVASPAPIAARTITEALTKSDAEVYYETLDEHSKADFRRRRLSWAPLLPMVVIPPPSFSSPVFKGLLLSREIGDEEEETELAKFLRKAVGSFSCHGIEPSYNNKKGHHVASKINQDKGFTTYPYNSNPRYALLGVYDGHGEHGHKVSKFVLNEIENNLELHPAFESDTAKAFEEVFVAADEELRDATFSAEHSGTTAVIVLIKDSELIMANVGDSRAVLGRKCESGTTEAHDLTVDQNPNSTGEMERIIAAGGFVTEPEEEGYAARVWLDKECTEIGLAMSRSIGDFAVKDVGVISTPVITNHILEERDEFLIVASDGVWEFITSQQAVDIVRKIIYEKGCKAACEELIETAAACWQEEEGDYRDDITTVIVNVCEMKKCFDQSFTG